MGDQPSKQVNRFALQLDESGSYDFVIDGVRLRGQIYGPDDTDGADVTLLSVQHALTSAEEQTRQLLGELPGEFIPDRVGLYFCPACGDEDCGGSSVSIDFQADYVVWRDIAHNLGPEMGRIQGWTSAPDNSIEGLGPYTFDRNEYTTALRELLRQLQDEHRAEQTRLARLADEPGNRAGLWAKWRGRRGRHRAIDE